VELAAEREQGTVNTQMSGRSDQDRADANTVLTLESETPKQEFVHAEREQVVANTQMSGRSDQDFATEANPVLGLEPECPQQGFVQIYWPVKHLRKHVNQIRTEISSFTPVYLKGDTDTEWYNFPETGYSVNRRNNGSWTNCTNQGLANHTFELFETWNGRNGQANYLGTYACLSVNRLSRKAFNKLPLRVSIWYFLFSLAAWQVKFPDHRFARLSLTRLGEESITRRCARCIIPVRPPPCRSASGAWATTSGLFRVFLRKRLMTRSTLCPDTDGAGQVDGGWPS